MKPRLMLTVDVEAHQKRAAEDHVERLIYGRQNGVEWGIGKMMDIADGFNVKMVFYLDFAEVAVYGEAITEVGKYIVTRGHDLQLHGHPDVLPTEFWKNRGISPQTNANLFTPVHADAYIYYLVNEHQKCAPYHPTAYRGGAFRINAPLLDALRKHKIPIDASYNLHSENRPCDLAPSKQFYWENGVLEIPIAVINDTNVFPTLASLDFNSARFNDRHDYKADVNVYMDNYRRFFDSFFKTFGTDAIASVVMHSWSFFQRAEDETYSVINPLAPKMFENLLLEYSKKFDIITVSDISQQINSQKFSNIIIPMPQGENLKMECPICGWTGKTFNPYNGRNNAECPICYSLERHRHLWLYYNYSQLLEIAVPKKVLIFAPSGSIISKLRRYKNLELVTADINPKRAEHQVDVQAIPFEDESFDFIECFFVLPYVEDDVKALNELHRVLKTNGKIALYLPIRAISEGSIDLYAVDTPFTETERKNNPGFRHVYGSDVLNWLALPGFNAQRIDNIVTYSPDELKRYGINSSSSIFILEKIKTTKNTDRIAEAYHGAMGENLCRATRDRIHWICERAIGENILDVGCSQGITTILLAREGKRVVGVDICQQGIDYAQQSLKNENKTTREYIKFLCTDFVSYAKKCNKKFDSIIMGEVLEHLTEPERFISKAYTILCDGGRLVATVPFGINNYHDHKRTYYLTAFYNLFIDKFTITEIKFLGDWIGIVGVKVKAEGIKLDSALFMQAEEAFMIREKELRRM